MKLHCKRKEAPLQLTEPERYVTITGFQHYYEHSRLKSDS